MNSKKYIKFYTFTNGCETVIFDTDKTKQVLINEYGLKQTENKEEADIVIFFPCTFTFTNETTSDNTIQTLEKSFINADLFVISGCFLKKTFESDKVVYVKFKDIFNTIKQYLDKKLYKKLKENYTLKVPFVGISRGCYGACSFCSIISVKGKHLSRKSDDIIKDISILYKDYHTIKLVGDEVAGYGMDTKSSLEGLINKIFKKFPEIKLELGQLNPNILKDWDDEQFGFLKDKRIVGNILLPIQSASNRILKKMNRFYTLDEYKKIYKKIVTLRGFDISTDFIVGFPTETEEEHEINKDFLSEFVFNHIEIFPFDKENKNTKAGRMKGQISENIRKTRVTELISEFINTYQNHFGNIFEVKPVINTTI